MGLVALPAVGPWDVSMQEALGPRWLNSAAGKLGPCPREPCSKSTSLEMPLCPGSYTPNFHSLAWVLNGVFSGAGARTGQERNRTAQGRPGVEGATVMGQWVPAGVTTQDHRPRVARSPAPLQGGASRRRGRTPPLVGEMLGVHSISLNLLTIWAHLSSVRDTWRPVSPQRVLCRVTCLCK